MMSSTEHAPAGGPGLLHHSTIDHVMSACNCSEEQVIRLLQVGLSNLGAPQLYDSLIALQQ